MIILQMFDCCGLPGMPHPDGHGGPGSAPHAAFHYLCRHAARLGIGGYVSLV